MIRLSTGMRAQLIWDAGLMQMLYGGYIRVYSGPQPASADMAPTGTLLAEITTDGVPWGSPGSALTLKDGSLTQLLHNGTWTLTAKAAGEAGWWRFVWWEGDSDTLSETVPRLDAAVSDTILGMPTTITDGMVIEGVTFQLNYL